MPAVGQFRDAGLAGALVVCDGGCVLAAGDDIHDLACAIDTGLAWAPRPCCFTFGITGLVRNLNIHGNLMISTPTFVASNGAT